MSFKLYFNILFFFSVWVLYLIYSLLSSILYRGGHGDLRYCGTELFSKRYVGNFDFKVRLLRYHPALRYAVFHSPG